MSAPTDERYKALLRDADERFQLEVDHAAEACRRRIEEAKMAYRQENARVYHAWRTGEWT